MTAHRRARILAARLLFVFLFSLVTLGAFAGFLALLASLGVTGRWTALTRWAFVSAAVVGFTAGVVLELCTSRERFKGVSLSLLRPILAVGMAVSCGAVGVSIGWVLMLGVFLVTGQVTPQQLWGPALRLPDRAVVWSIGALFASVVTTLPGVTALWYRIAGCVIGLTPEEIVAAAGGRGAPSTP